MDVFIYKLWCSFSFVLHFILFKGGYPLHTPTLTNAGTLPCIHRVYDGTYGRTAERG